MGPKIETVESDHIRSAVKSPSLCTPKIVQQLAIILNRPLGVFAGIDGQSKIPLGTLPRQKFSSASKVVFATEVFNAALKSLTCAVRHRSVPEASLEQDDLDSGSSVQSIATTTKSANLENVALCANIALASLSASKSNKADDRQLFAGASSMIGKLIVLGFYDLATKSLEALMIRLGLLSDRTSPAPKSKALGSGIARLLDTRPEFIDDRLLGIVIACQLHATKLLAYCDAIEIEVAAGPLASEKLSNPLRLILGAHERGALNDDSAEKYLIGLSNSLHNLCTVQGFCGNVLDNVATQISPSTAIKYQFLIQEAQQKVLLLRNRQVDVTKDVMKPFLRSVKKFHQRVTILKVEDYDHISSAFESRKKLCEANRPKPDSASDKQFEKTMSEVRAVLSTIKTTLGRTSETDLLTRSKHNIPNNILASKCYELCKTCSSILQSSESHGSIKSYFSEISRLVDEVTDTSSSIWDEIILLLSTIRRLAFDAWRNRLKAYPNLQDLPNMTDTLTYTHIILKIPSICLLYLHMSSEYSKKDSQQRSGSHQSEMINRVARPTIDAVIRVATVALKGSNYHLDELYSALDNCCTIISSLESAQGFGSLRELDKRLKGVHGALSDCLASVATTLKQPETAIDKDQRLSLLEKSVTLLSQYPAESQSSFNVLGKVERLANALTIVGRLGEAQNYLHLAIQSSYNTGVLEHGLSAGGPLYVIHGENIHQHDVVRFIRLIRTHFAVATETSQFPSFSVSVFGDPEHNPRRDWFVSMCQLIEAAKMVKRKHTLSSSLTEEAVKLFLSTRFYSDDNVQKLESLSIILQVVANTGLTLQDNIRATLWNKLLDAKDQLGAEMSDYIRILFLSCQINLLLAEPETNWQPLCANVASLRSVLRSEDLMMRSDTCFRSFQLELLELLSEFFGLHGFPLERMSCLDVLAGYYRPTITAESFNRKAVLYSLSSEYIRYGFLEHASATISAYIECSRTDKGNNLCAAKTHILRTRYYSALGKYAEAAENVTNASEIIKATKYVVPGISNHHKFARVELMETYSDLLESQFELREFQAFSAETMLFARAYAKYAYKIWNFLDKTTEQCNGENYHKQSENCCSDANTEMMDSIVLPGEVKNNNDRRLWSINIVIIRSLLKLSACLENMGQINEARYYLLQAKDTAICSRSLNWKRAVELDLARLGRLEGTLKDPIIELKEISEKCILGTDFMTIRAKFEMCDTYLRRKDWSSLGNEFSEALEMLKQADAEKERYNASDPRSLPAVLDEAAFPSEKSDKKETPFNLRLLYGSLESPPFNTQAGPLLAYFEYDPKNFLSRFRDQILLYLINLEISRGNHRLAEEIVRRAEDFGLRPIDISSYRMTFARLRIHWTFELLSASPIFNALCDAPVSFPCQRSTPLKPSPSTTKLESLQEKNKKARRIKNLKSCPLASDFPSDTLKAALNELIQAVDNAYQGWPTFRMHEASDDLVKVTMLLAAGTTAQYEELDAYSAIIALEIGRNFAWKKYMATSAIEKGLRNIVLEPTANLSEHKNYLENFDITSHAAQFRDLYIEILPRRWAVISISLSRDGSELRISRLRRGCAPFVVSVPLNRNSEDTEETVFDFQACKSELTDIVNQANDSTRDIVSEGKKGARSKWWRTRTQLDERLKNLLTSIDDIWIGGFRGIFSQRDIDTAVFNQFCSNFQKILQKHLPSRQGRSKTKIADQVMLDTQVLELFIGLGAPDDEGGLDDPLLDLLSFTVDVLQFHGESNAYDEIDFDSMILDITEALRQYHFATDSADDKIGVLHTLLILDKHLHSFPWESVPSLQGLSISRLPSLEAMRNILCSYQGIQDGDKSQSKIHVNASDGAYVLNPGGDLINTEKEFKARLSKLPGSWTRFVGEPPKEADLESCLQEKSLYLYFGHGSGGQYIRSRTVKNLQRCAVSLLLGCSSMTVTEAGHFESYGTPLTYLLAGSSAVVGTLWDVTDKDIDRFSTKLLEYWGLFHNETLHAQSPKKERHGSLNLPQRGDNNHSSTEANQPTAASLDTAIACARDACLMRYLNGASPVIYGVPVYLM